MEKTVNHKYPEEKKQYLEFSRALISLLNCGRYAEAVGFKNDKNNSELDYSASIVLEDESNITNEDYKNSNDKNNVIEQMILRKGYVKIIHNWAYYDLGASDNLIVRVFEKEADNSRYNIKLSIGDITKESFGFFRRGFHEAERFAFDYHLSLKKEIINEEDMVPFRIYEEALHKVARVDRIIPGQNFANLAHNQSDLRLESGLVLPAIAPAITSESSSIAGLLENRVGFSDPWELMKEGK